MLNLDISFIDYPSIPLETGYTTAQATQNAYCIKVGYNDIITMTNVSYILQDGTDFSTLTFLASDSATAISPPTTLTDGMVFYIVFPIDLGKPLGVYSDVLLIDGNYGSMPLPSYIRRVIQQRVVFDDSYDNDYIRVKASPDWFTAPYPAAKTTKLILNIDHTGTPVLYDPLDVDAIYLVTTIPDYDLAIAADPLFSSNWKSLNVPATNNGSATTTVSFSSLPLGNYYIHWYAESGVVYAHSLSISTPAAQYGGFGPYIILDSLKAGTIKGVDTCNGYPLKLTGTVSTRGNGNYVYEWQSSTSSSDPWTNIINSNSQNYTTGILTPGVYYFRRLTHDSVTVSGITYPAEIDTSNVITVTVHPVYKDLPVPAIICDGDSIFFGRRYYKTTDIYTDTLKTIFGCDSIVTLNLTVNPVYKDLPVSRSICKGDSVFFGRHYYKTNGIHIDTLRTILDCDSIITLNLTVNPVYKDLPVSASICEGDSIFFGRRYYKTVDIYTDTMETTFGCDSIITLNLTFLQSYHDTINATICQNEIYNDHGFAPPSYNAGFFTYVNPDKTFENCDSITVLNLMVNPVYSEYVSAQIYEDEFYYIDKYKYNTPGLHIANLQTVENCDSIINLSLSLIYYPPAITAFSPFNKDGINDYFMAGFKIQVFNRHGILVYETITTEELERGWDGRNYKKQDVEPGIYFYILYNSSNKPRIKSSVEVLKR